MFVAPIHKEVPAWKEPLATPAPTAPFGLFDIGEPWCQQMQEGWRVTFLDEIARLVADAGFWITGCEGAVSFKEMLTDPCLVAQRFRGFETEAPFDDIGEIEEELRYVVPDPDRPGVLPIALMQADLADETGGILR